MTTAKLKSAIKKYQPLLAEGVSLDDIKATIIGDNYTEEETAEILGKLAPPEQPAPAAKKQNKPVAKKPAAEKPGPEAAEAEAAESDPKTETETETEEDTPSTVQTEEDVKVSRPSAVRETVERKFNFKNLVDEEYNAYLKHVSSLKKTDEFVFEQYRVKAVRKERYPGLPQSPVDMVGIALESDTPINRTKISVRHAETMNAQVMNSGRYFLLKQ